MEFLIEYHLIFMVLAIFLFIIQFFMLFDDPTPDKLKIALFFAVLNLFIFFPLVEMGFTTLGLNDGSTVTAYYGMNFMASIFYAWEAFEWLFVFYALLLYFWRKPWGGPIKDEGI